MEISHIMSIDLLHLLRLSIKKYKDFVNAFWKQTKNDNYGSL